MINTLRRSSNNLTIANLYEYLERGKFNFHPPYQRHSIWSEEKQSFLIDSIMKNFPIPPIFLREKIDDNGFVSYDVVDGKQRLLSIERFIKNEIPVSTEQEDGPFDDRNLAGAMFCDLDKPELADYKRRFWRYSLSIEYVDTEDSNVIDSIFDRLNRNGEPLTGQELRNANYHGTRLLDAITQFAEDSFWRARLEYVDRQRMEDHEFLSEIVFLLLEGKLFDSKPQVLDDLYEKHRDLPDAENLEAKFNKLTADMNSLQVDYDRDKVKGVSHLYGLWSFVWYCDKAGVDVAAHRNKIHDLFDQLRHQKSENKHVLEYRKSMSSRTKSRSARQQRLKSMLHFCEIPREGQSPVEF